MDGGEVGVGVLGRVYGVRVGDGGPGGGCDVGVCQGRGDGWGGVFGENRRGWGWCGC